MIAADSLEIRGLRTSFATARGTLTAVDGIDLEVKPGEVLGLVGEVGVGQERGACVRSWAWCDRPAASRAR